MLTLRRFWVSENPGRIKTLKSLAEGGDVQAQYRLGHLYARGIETPSDVEKARHWFRLAADGGHPRAWDRLDELNGGSEVDYSSFWKESLAIEFLKEMADQEHPHAVRELGNRLFFGADVPKNDFLALKYYRVVAETGGPAFLRRIGEIYLRDEGVPRNEPKAQEWFARAASLYHLLAGGFAGSVTYTRLGVMYERGLGVTQDMEQAFMWYFRSARMWNLEGLLKVMQLHADGYGADMDLDATRWAQARIEDLFHRAEDEDDADLQFMIAERYENGRSFEQDYSTAARWYRKAAENGHDQAQYKLAEMYEWGFGLPLDLDEAFKWYRKASFARHPGAQYRLGVIYLKKGLTSWNIHEALRWFIKAAHNEHPLAEPMLKFLCDKGCATCHHLEDGERMYVPVTANEQDEGG